MMKPDLLEKVKGLSEYHALVKERRFLAVLLSSIIMIVYFGFILLVAFAPDFFKTIVWGQNITVGFPLGVGIILLGFLLTAIYVFRANQRFDQLTEKIKQAVE